jgi:hypothetical protein
MLLIPRAPNLAIDKLRLRIKKRRPDFGAFRESGLRNPNLTNVEPRSTETKSDDCSQQDLSQILKRPGSAPTIAKASTGKLPVYRDATCHAHAAGTIDRAKSGRTDRDRKLNPRLTSQQSSAANYQWSHLKRIRPPIHRE